MSISGVGMRLDMNGDLIEEEVESLLSEFLSECLLFERKRLILPLESSATTGTVTVDGCVLEDECIDIEDIEV
jgi:hypothetical protein